MSGQPKVSIILVNYNGYQDTIDCLRSLREITYQNHEAIIVDNASTNDSVERLIDAIDDREILIRSENNDGFAAGNNIGIRYALAHGADYCLLLNNDTVTEPGFLDHLIEGFGLSERCGLTIGKILYEGKRDIIWYAGGSISRKNGKTMHWHYREKDAGLPEAPQKVSFATGCCMCLSREAIEKVGLMDESYFLYEEDTDYCCRIADAGFEMIYIPQARIYHKVNASTGQKPGLSQYYSVRNKYRMIQKNLSGMNQYLAYCYITAQYLYRCTRKKLALTDFLAGVSAFRRSESGKKAEYERR
ncbi:MAG: glycosyltransferase family 2 protein [Solobacterium sp.]|nr:glycosyltransferase family 2 protein [Solobacterium sp.]